MTVTGSWRQPQESGELRHSVRSGLQLDREAICVGSMASLPKKRDRISSDHGSLDRALASREELFSLLERLSATPLTEHLTDGPVQPLVTLAADVGVNEGCPSPLSIGASEDRVAARTLFIGLDPPDADIGSGGNPTHQ